MSSVSSGSINDHLGITLASTTTDFTVMCRYRLNALPSSTALLTVATKSGLTDDVEIDLHTDGTILLASFQSGSYQSTAAAGSLSTGSNYHICIVHKQGVTTTLYVNGTQVAQIAGITFQLDEWAIGAGGLAPSFTAENPKVWLRALSGSEVAQEISQFAPQSSTSNLWDWWNFNVQKNNFEFLDGQVNGSSRQVAYQGTFTVSSDQLPIALFSSFDSDISAIGARRNRPGRGPYSKNNYKRPSYIPYSTAVPSVPISESASASDSVTSTLVALGNLGESAAATFTPVAYPLPSQETLVSLQRNRPGRGPYSLGPFYRSMDDPITTVVSSGTVYNVSVSESGIASDSEFPGATGNVTEAASASVSYSATEIINVTVAEAANAQDAIAEGSLDSISVTISAATVSEGGTLVATAKFYSGPVGGILTTPDSVDYRIDSTSTGTEVRTWTPAVPFSTVSVLIDETDTQMVIPTDTRENFKITFRASKGTATVTGIGVWAVLAAAGHANLGYKVTTRSFSLEDMVSRAWGSEFKAPDHRVYEFSNGRAFDSTDMGETGIYRRR